MKRNIVACTGEEGWCKDCLHENTPRCWRNFPKINKETKFKDEGSMFVLDEKTGRCKEESAESHFPGTSEALWSGIRVWYPPNDPNGKPYRTKFKKKEFNPKTSEMAVTMELIPEEICAEESPVGSPGAWEFSSKCPLLDGKECQGANASDCTTRMSSLLLNTKLSCPTFSSEELSRMKRGLKPK